MLAFTALAPLAIATGGATFAPVSFHLSDLVDDARFAAALPKLRAALSESGIVQVKGLPKFGPLREGALLAASECTATEGFTHTFPDGTVRRSVASRTLPGPGGAAPFAPAKCAAFDEKVAPLREAVGEATAAFAARLGSMLHVETPLLTTPSGHAFHTFADVVDAGEHLEHFHSYARPAAESAGAEPTLDMHTDQGLFIAFTPALDVVDGAASAGASAAFHVGLPGGGQARAIFEPSSLVFMLGDGVEQVVAPKLLTDKAGAPPFKPRATPHALTVPPASAGHRMWYGRMVLAPHDALVDGGVVNGKGDVEQTTYGDVRARLMRAAGAPGAAHPTVGCSHSPDHAAARGRTLQYTPAAEPTCANNTLRCWHRCMPTEPYGATAELCGAQGLQLQCVNQRFQLVNVESHGDTMPMCTNTTVEETPLPPLPHAPRANTCDGTFADFASSAGYDKSLELHGSCSAGWGQPASPCEAVAAKLMWTVRDGTLRAKLAHNGLFGWIGFGLANPGGGHNGMNGGRVVMAMPGAPSSYTAMHGLANNMTSPTVNEFIISEGASAFRHWQTPFAPAGLSAAAFEANDCHSAMSFTASSISGWPLHLDATDEIIWAANGVDAFMGSHGATSRGKLVIDWAAGVATPAPAAAPALLGAGAAVGLGLGALCLGAIAGALAVAQYRKAPAAPAGEKKFVDVAAAANAQ